jgi:hypothetical protein
MPHTNHAVRPSFPCAYTSRVEYTVYVVFLCVLCYRVNSLPVNRTNWSERRPFSISLASLQHPPAPRPHGIVSTSVLHTPNGLSLCFVTWYCSAECRMRSVECGVRSSSISSILEIAPAEWLLISGECAVTRRFYPTVRVSAVPDIPPLQ